MVACHSETSVNTTFFLSCGSAAYRDMASSFLRVLDHRQHTTVGRAPLGQSSPRRRDLYLATHNIHKRQSSMPPAGFEPVIPVSERPQTHAFNRAVTGTGHTTAHGAVPSAVRTSQLTILLPLLYEGVRLGVVHLKEDRGVLR
jgi:hypothetical protein